MNAEAFFCKFCQKEWPSPSSRARHEIWCKANPDQSRREARGHHDLRVDYEPREPDKPYQFKALRPMDEMPYKQHVPSKHELDQYEIKLLDVLCRLGHSPSSVSLAADMYETTEEVQESRVLEWNLIELMLHDLNVKGLVRYRLGEGDLFVRIRPTFEAYKALKIQYRWMTTVGASFHHLRERPKHEGDMTDFRSHTYRADANAVTKEDFIDHCAGLESSHLAKHRRQLIELYGTDDL